MDLVPRLVDYVANFPRTEDVSELKSQLSGCTHADLRAACSLLHFPVSKKSKKKSGYINSLVSYWRGDVAKIPAKTTEMSQPKANLPHHPMPVHEASDVVNYVQQFAADGDVNELRDQLNGCTALILRSACVQLSLRPNRKHFAKANFVDLLVDYWQQSAAGCYSPIIVTHEAVSAPVSVTSEPEVAPRVVSEETEKEKEKRLRYEEPMSEQKRAKVELGDIGEEKTTLTASLEKAKVVKEWASAIEILSRVDGSTESIASIRTLIDNLIESAVTDL